MPAAALKVSAVSTAHAFHTAGTDLVLCAIRVSRGSLI